jgi:hypothetical protein
LAKMAGRKRCGDIESGVLDIWDLVSGKTTTLAAACNKHCTTTTAAAAAYHCPTPRIEKEEQSISNHGYRKYVPIREDNMTMSAWWRVCGVLPGVNFWVDFEYSTGRLRRRASIIDVERRPVALVQRGGVRGIEGPRLGVNGSNKQLFWMGDSIPCGF